MIIILASYSELTGKVLFILQSVLVAKVVRIFFSWSFHARFLVAMDCSLSRFMAYDLIFIKCTGVAFDYIYFDPTAVAVHSEDACQIWT